MKEKPNLLKRLMEYGNSDFYPFHMPGHKRQYRNHVLSEFPNPFSIDITEINGFDNLHHPEGILKDSMEWAAQIYGSDKTYYLVNGSSCGILSAISGSVNNRGTILMSRNCHKSAFHGVFLNQLNAKYIYPQLIPEMGLQGGILAEDVEGLLKKYPEIEAVLVVSPTYDGVVSDIKAIAQVVHRFGLPLIVDEAHGAHFSFGKDNGFPVSALDLGADIVIQSLHKTLPSLTQTALLHVRKGYIDIERLDRYIHMYQTSSPSYVMMASIENCIRYMEDDGIVKLKDFSERIANTRKCLEKMVNLKVLSERVIGCNGVFDIDISKIIISTRNTGWSGSQLDQVLRKEYHLEMEMCGSDYVTAITTLVDTEEGIDRLCAALMEIDGKIDRGIVIGNTCVINSTDEHSNADVTNSQDILSNACAIRRADVSKDADVIRSAEVTQSSEKLNNAGVIRNMKADEAGIKRKNDISDIINHDSHLNKESRYCISQAMDAKRTRVLIKDAVGKVSSEFVYLYPPGIPIAVPGEVLTDDDVEIILEYKRLGLPVQGMEDEAAEAIFVMIEK